LKSGVYRSDAIASSLELLRNNIITVRPELVEGHSRRFDKLSANGPVFSQHAVLRNNSIVSFPEFSKPFQSHAFLKLSKSEYLFVPQRPKKQGYVANHEFQIASSICCAVTVNTNIMNILEIDKKNYEKKLKLYTNYLTIILLIIFKLKSRLNISALY
jgi:hypothetical protein